VRFFSKHGFAPTTTYELSWEGRRCPPKAILGTAYEFATCQRPGSSDIAPNDRCPATVERYRTLITAHILSGLGGVTLQALDGPALDRFYSRCRTQGRRDGKGLSPMTLRHVNALLSQVLKSAVMANLIA
jgi:hypothetical protein